MESRKLPAGLVDRLYDKGLIYADNFQNAVFVRHALSADSWMRGEVTGASLRGTWGEKNAYRGLAPGSDKENGWFWIGAGKGEIRRVLLTESAIDAMSLAVLDKQRQAQQGVTLYLSTDGSGTVPLQALGQLLNRKGQVVAAFDDDRAGEEMAWQIAQQLSGVSRMTPAYGKDWNERLVCDGQPEQANLSDLDKPTLRSLWQWYQAARLLSKSEAYLSRITEVARAALQGELLSQTAQTTMQQDLRLAQRSIQLEV